MAALLVLAGAIIHDKVKEKKEMKRRKVLDDERRHRELQAETNRKEKGAGVERNYDSEDEKEDEDLPRYEDIIDNGEGSSSNANMGSSGLRDGNEQPPPHYGRHPVEPRRHSGV
ncbi:hypothetical protein MBLNU13_g08218t1 [Cladosporium sp. NU13]